MRIISVQWLVRSFGTNKQTDRDILSCNDIHLFLLQDKGKGRKGGAGAQFLDYEAQLSGSDEGSDAHRYYQRSN